VASTTPRRAWLLSLAALRDDLTLPPPDQAGDVFREVWRSPLVEEAVWSVAFSPDGTRLATGSDDDHVRLWDVASGEEIARLEGHTERISVVAFSPDGARLVSGSDDGTIRLWDVASGREMAHLTGHE
jgi:WD40 repeat protein